MGNPWMDHVKTVKKANPGKSLKEILKMAGKTYKKQAKAPGAKKAKKTRKVRKSRKGSRKGTKKARRSRRHKGGKPVESAPTPGSENFASV
jgi:ribosomal protein L12E/L44/L45/RPP1/RPP2